MRRICRARTPTRRARRLVQQAASAPVGRSSSHTPFVRPASNTAKQIYRPSGLHAGAACPPIGSPLCVSSRADGAVGIDHPDRGAVLRAEAERRDVGMLVGLKGDARTVGRPRRLRSVGDDLLRRAAARRHDPDAAVAMRVIRDEPAVGRPRRLNVLSAVARQRRLRRRAVERPHEDLERAGAIGHVRDGIAVRRERRMQIEPACVVSCTGHRRACPPPATLRGRTTSFAIPDQQPARRR